MEDLNVICMTGNLTRDPELRALQSGTAVCSMRIASNRRQKDSSTGEWGDVAGYFDVTAWGRQAETCAQYLAKGRKILVKGELRWREWQDKDGNKRQSYEINAESIQFLGSPKEGGGGQQYTGQSDIPADPGGAGFGTPGGGGGFGVPTGQPATAGAPAGGASGPYDDDIPF